MAETLITSAADIERHFSPEPPEVAQLTVLITAIADAINANLDYATDRREGFGVRATVKPAQRTTSGNWYAAQLELNGTRYYDLSYNAGRKPSLTVGRYGNRVTFPRKSDGTYSYDKIAAHIVQQVYRQWWADRQNDLRNQRDEEMKDTIAALREELGLRDYGFLRIEAGLAEGTLLLRFGSNGISHVVTADHVRGIANALHAAGIAV